MILGLQVLLFLTGGIVVANGDCILSKGPGDVEGGVDRLGTDVATKDGVVGGWQSCARYCERNEDCEFWVLKVDETCILRKSFTEEQVDPSVEQAGYCPEGAPKRENCYDDHRRGKNCTWNRNEEDCLEKYNETAGKPGLSRIEQICGWSTTPRTPHFNGLHKKECRSKPWVLRTEDAVNYADFGACSDEIMEEAGIEESTEPPTSTPTEACAAGTCSQFDGMRKECQASPPLCDVDCAWNKKTKLCEPYACKHFNPVGVKCTPQSAKKGLTCYYNIKTEECEEEVPDATCKDYDQFVFDDKTPSGHDDDEGKVIATRSVSRKRCKKLGRPYLQCKWSGMLKKCIEKGEKPDCTKIAANPSKCKLKDGCVLTTVSGCMKFEDVRCSDYRSPRSERKCFKGSKGGHITKGKGCKVLKGRCVDA